jgi:hypothetical protein
MAAGPTKKICCGDDRGGGDREKGLRSCKPFVTLSASRDLTVTLVGEEAIKDRGGLREGGHCGVLRARQEKIIHAP